MANVDLLQGYIHCPVNLRWSFFWKPLLKNPENCWKLLPILAKKLLLRGLTWFWMFCLIKNYDHCFSLIIAFKKLQLIQLEENDSKPFSQQNFHCFTGEECLHFLRSRFLLKFIGCSRAIVSSKTGLQLRKKTINFAMRINSVSIAFVTWMNLNLESVAIVQIYWGLLLDMRIQTNGNQCHIICQLHSN